MCWTFLPRFRRIRPLTAKPARCLRDIRGVVRVSRSGQVGQEQQQNAVRWKVRRLLFPTSPHSRHNVKCAMRTTRLKFAEVFKPTHNFRSNFSLRNRPFINTKFSWKNAQDLFLDWIIFSFLKKIRSVENGASECGPLRFSARLLRL
jgi:hypothetical protein